MINADKLLDMKEEIEEFEKELTEAEAKSKLIMEQIQEKYGVMTIEEAEEMLEKITEEYNKLNKKHEKEVKVLDEQINAIRRA